MISTVQDWKQSKKGDTIYVICPKNMGEGEGDLYEIQESKIRTIKEYLGDVIINCKITNLMGKRQRMNFSARESILHASKRCIGTYIIARTNEEAREILVNILRNYKFEL